ncbi:MAG: TlpA family protein disulfide reductase [Caldilineales bacterium]|nr:TlpA family protein disulfide reductase [Caldilineales bacterium]
MSTQKSPGDSSTAKLKKGRQQALAVAVIAIGVAALMLAYVMYLHQSEEPQSLSLAAANGLFPVASLHAVDNSNAQPDAGSMAPDFAIHLTDGTTTHLSDYRGRPVLLNFWATWCPPCRLEMPDLEAAYKQYGDDLVVLGIDAGEAHESVATFQKEMGISLPLVIDPRQEVMAAYKTNSLPSSFFIDRNGRVRVRWIGLLTPDVLQEHLQQIL